MHVYKKIPNKYIYIIQWHKVSINLWGTVYDIYNSFQFFSVLSENRNIFSFPCNGFYFTWFELSWESFTSKDLLLLVSLLLFKITPQQVIENWEYKMHETIFKTNWQSENLRLELSNNATLQSYVKLMCWRNSLPKLDIFWKCTHIQAIRP